MVNDNLPHVKGRNRATQRHDSVMNFDRHAAADPAAQIAEVVIYPIGQFLIGG